MTLEEVVKREESKTEGKAVWEAQKAKGFYRLFQWVVHLVVMTGRKSGGAGAPSPPPHSWKQVCLQSTYYRVVLSRSTVLYGVPIAHSC